MVDALELNLEDYARAGRTVQPIRGFRVGMIGRGESRVEYDHVVSYGIRRCEFDDHLLARSGARLRLGEPVHRIERIGSDWVVNGALRAAVLIGAGGHFCPVARHVGARLGSDEPVVAAQELEVALTPEHERSCAVEEEIPEIYFSPDLRGYGWVFRKGKHINVGLGRQDARRLGDHVDSFFGFLRGRGKMPDLAARLCGHAYLLYDQAPRPLIGDGFLLVGDAAGFAYPKSGEGIRPAVESGLLAAETVLNAAGRYAQEQLAGYERACLERFGRREAGSGITNLLPSGLARALASRLFATPSFARRVVLDRWFFHRAQAALVLRNEAVRPLHLQTGTFELPS